LIQFGSIGSIGLKTKVELVPVSAAIATTAAWTAIFAWSSFADLNLTIVHRITVELRDGLRGFFGCVHFDKPKALGAACLAVSNDSRIGDSSSLLEQFTQFVLGATVPTYNFLFILRSP
jgi:hypothetical protein